MDDVYPADGGDRMTAVEGVYPADGEDRPGMMEVVARKDVKARKDEDGSLSNSEG